MFRRLRHMVVAIAGLSGVGAMVWADSAYLPAVGPDSLRFCPLPAAVTRWTSIPAPITPEMRPVEEEPAKPVPVIAPVPPPAAVTYTAGSTPEAATPPATPVGSPDTTPAVSPQMLIKYFLPGTNSPALPLQNSVGFTPPSPSGSSRGK